MTCERRPVKKSDLKISGIRTLSFLGSGAFFSFQRVTRGLRQGFTLVELLVTVAVLGFGIVTIYETFFISMDMYGYYSHYLSTQDWLNEQVSSLQKDLMDTGTLKEGSTGGEMIRGQKVFNWIMDVSLIDERQALYQVQVTLSWKEGNKTVQASRAAYLMPPQLKIYHEEIPV